MNTYIDIHKINAVLLAASVAAFATAAIQSLPDPAPSGSMAPISTAQPALQTWHRLDFAFPERNIFDPGGVAWDTPVHRLRANLSVPAPQALATGRPSIGGTVILGGIRGVFAGGQFIPIGEDVEKHRLDDVASGRARFVDPSGATMVVEPGAARNERIEKLLQSDRPNSRQVAPRKTP